MNTIHVTLENRLERLQTFSALEQGWLDGVGGDPISPIAYDNAERFLRQAFLDIGIDDSTHSDLLPAVFPMEDGGISLEWFNGRILTIECLPDGKVDCFFDPVDGRETISSEGLPLEEAIIYARKCLEENFG